MDQRSPARGKDEPAGEPPTGHPSGERGIVDELVDDHRRIRSLLRRLSRARRWQRSHFYLELRRTMIAHEAAEQSVVYPALAHVVLDDPSLDPHDVAPPLVEEERHLEPLVVAVADAGRGRARFRRAVAELLLAVDAHIAHEERAVLCLLGRLAQPDTAARLATEFRRVRARAPTRSHPHVPKAPPLSLPVLPLLGRADRVADRVLYWRTALRMGGVLWALSLVPRLLGPVVGVASLLLLDRLDRPGRRRRGGRRPTAAPGVR